MSANSSDSEEYSIIDNLNLLELRDTVRFGVKQRVVCFGVVVQITEKFGNVFSIRIRHMDENPNKTYLYFPADFRWISRHEILTASIVNFSDLHVKMLVQTETASGSLVRG